MAITLAISTLIAVSIKSVNATPNVVLIYADDMGWADLGANGVAEDVLTPNLDALAASGVRFTNSYVTAPQCAPSRAGLLTGSYQQEFGYESNIHGPLPLSQTTIAERIRDEGYTTGIVGKWHLEPRSANKEWVDANLNGDWGLHTEADIAPYRSYNRGFTDAFEGDMTSVRATFDLAGNTLTQPTLLQFPNEYRIELKTQAALSFVDRHAGESDPFFLYLSYFTPHAPLEAPQEYLDRFPGEMPERRRYALAMNSAMDDGVGQLMSKLDQHGLTNDTLVMFISDNGAPLLYDMQDTPLPQFGWNGSLNTPFVGQKETLTEGGIRVPFVASWPGTLPAGTVYEEPVLQIDASATAVALAGGNTNTLDGKNLIPHLLGQNTEAPHEVLYWRMRFQEAVREDDWKLIRMPDRQKWLFDLSIPEPERANLAGQHPEVVARLSQLLDDWSGTLQRPLLTSASPAVQTSYNHALPLPLTLLDPKVAIDLGYESSENMNQVVIDQGSLEHVLFSGIRLGAGVEPDLRPGVALSIMAAGGGAQAFSDWDLPAGSGSLLQTAIDTDHYIEFDLTLNGSEVLSIDGVQIAGSATSRDANVFTLLASDDGFASGAMATDAISQKAIGDAYGDPNSSSVPVRNYRFVDYIPGEPLPIDELGTTWTFRLYVHEDGVDDLNALVIHSIAFDFTAISPGDLNRDGDVDNLDLDYFVENHGEVHGNDFLEWQRHMGSQVSASASRIPEPGSLVLFLLACLLSPAAASRITRRFQ